MIESAVTDLPQPDSPTMPSVLPFSTAKLIAVDGAHHALAGEEVRPQIVDLEQRQARSPSSGGRARRAARPR